MARNNPKKWARMAAERKKRLARIRKNMKKMKKEEEEWLLPLRQDWKKPAKAFTPPKNPNNIVSRRQAFVLVKYLKPKSYGGPHPFGDAINALIEHGMTQQQWYDAMKLARNKRKIPAMKRKLEELIRERITRKRTFLLEQMADWDRG